MTEIVYQIVRHDGGWAYRVNETYSEPFRTHDEARRAAALAAREQEEPGSATLITWEDEQGHWHRELAGGTDRPHTKVRG